MTTPGLDGILDAVVNLSGHPDAPSREEILSSIAMALGVQQPDYYVIEHDGYASIHGSFPGNIYWDLLRGFAELGWGHTCNWPAALARHPGAVMLVGTADALSRVME